MATNNPEVKIRLVVEDGRLKAGLGSATQNWTSFVNKVQASAQSTAGSLSSLDSGLARLNASMTQLKVLGAGFLGFEGLKSIAQSLVQVQLTAQNIKYSLQAAAGSAELGAREYEFVRESAQRLGLSLQDVAQQYGKILVAARSAQVPLQDTHALFNKLSEAAVVLHLGNQEVTRAYYAIGQMMSMGSIRTEELRLQLGEAIPGVYAKFQQLVEDSGVNFKKALENGELSIRKYGKFLTQALDELVDDRDVAGASKALNAELNRMKTALYEFKSSLTSGEFEEFATAGVQAATRITKAFSEIFGEGMGPKMALVTGMAAGWLLLVKGLSSGKEKIQGMAEAMNGEYLVTEAARKAHVAKAAAHVAEAEAIAVNAAKVAQLAAAEAAVLAETEAMVIARREAAAEALVQAQAEGASKVKLLALQEALNAAQLEEIAIKRQAAAAAATKATTAAAAELAQTEAGVAVEAAKAAGSMTLLSGATKAVGGVFKSVLALVGGWPGVLAIGGIALGAYILKQGELGRATEDLEVATKKLTKAKLENVEASWDETVAAAASAKQKLEETQAAKAEIEARLSGGDFNALSPAEWYRGIKDNLDLNKATHEVYEFTEAVKKTNEAMEQMRSLREEALWRKDRQGELDLAGGRLQELKKSTETKLGKIKHTRPDGSFDTAAALQDEMQKELERNHAVYAQLQTKARSDLEKEALIEAEKVREDVIKSRFGAEIEAERALARQQASKDGKKAVKDEKEHLKELDEALGVSKKLTEEAESLEIKNQHLTEFQKTRLQNALEEQRTWDEGVMKIMMNDKLSPEEKAKALDLLVEAQKRLNAAKAQELQLAEDADTRAKRAGYRDAKEDAQKFLDENTRNAMPDGKAKGIADAKAQHQVDLAEFDQKATASNMSFEEYNAGIEKLNANFAGMIKKIHEGDNALSEFAKSAAQNMETYLANSIMELATSADNLGESFKKMGSNFAKVLMNMVANLAASQLLEKLFGSKERGVAGLINLFGPARKSHGGEVRGYSTGGSIKGPGSTTSDSIPIMVSDGEYVVQASAVKRVGVNFLDAINNMRTPPKPRRAFATGGLVGAVSDATPGNRGAGTTVNVSNYTGQPVETETRTGPSGEEIVEMVIGRVARDIAKGGTVGKTLQAQYGLDRKGTRRG